MTSSTVDVVIPVYNQLGLVTQCLESLLRAECSTSHRIVVIDDCSTETELCEYLEKMDRLGAIELHRNKRNLGFTRTVNFGMQLHAERDVVLLNSDTIVYKQWLDRLRAAAMSSDDIATVNPMTTQLGSHISCYPGLGTQFLGDLEVDDEELDSITNEMNRQRFIPVHVTVGFCMYIRRQCLNEIGYFDSINFPIAYGEESDFCYRARKARWRHMIAGDVFVTHLEGRSFSDRKQQLMNDMFKRFIVLHPETPEFDQRFLRQDPLRILRAGIDIGRIRRLLGGKDVIALARDDAAPSRTRRPWLSFNPETYLTKIVVPDVPEQSLPNVDQFRLPLDNLKLSQTLARLGVNSLICSSENLANSFELARKVAHPEEINLNIAVRVGVNF